MDCWYAVRCKSRQEHIAKENLLRQGFCVYFPKIELTQRQRGKWSPVVAALFPGYLFIHVDPQRQSMTAVRSTRGAIDLMRFGGQPAVVPDDVIETVRRQEDPASGLYRENRALFRQGESVKFVDGPLIGLEGIFNRQDGDERVVILLELLGKFHRVKANRDWVVQAA